MYNGLYLACMLSAATTATVMWWVLRQNLRAPRIAADQLPQRRLRDLQHLGKAFIVVPVTVLTEQYVYSTHDFAHQIRMLEGFQWLLGHGMWAFGFILVWDWAVRKTLQTNPHRLPALQRIAALCVCLYAVLSVFGLWYIQSTVPHSTANSAHEADLWKATERVAASVQNDPTYSLRVVNDHIDALFMSRRAPYELFEIGEQRGVALFWGRSYAGLRRWGALSNLLKALVERARIAARRGHWQECRQAFRLAIRTMEKVADLQVPQDLKPRMDPHLVPVRFFALAFIRDGYERIHALLGEIASSHAAQKAEMEYALLVDRRIGSVLAEVARKSRPLLGIERRNEQQRQLETTSDEALHALGVLLRSWSLAVEDALTQITSTSDASR